MSQICRLCLNTSSSHYEKVKHLDQRQFRLVLPEIDLDIVCTSLICSKCVELLNVAYSFKNNCLETEKLLKSYIERFGKTNIDLSGVLKEFLICKNASVKIEGVDENDDNNCDGPNHNGDNYDGDDYDGDYLSDDKDMEEALKQQEKNYGDSYVSDVEDTLKKSFICLICSGTYKSKQILLDHVAIHFRRPKCNVCTEILSSLNELKEHSALMHGVTLRNVSNDFDGIEFELDHKNMEDALKRHLEVYKEEERNNSDSSDGNEDNTNVNNDFKCEICEKNFQERSKLNKHMKTHFYRLKCLVCNKLFSTIQSFRKHVLAIHKLLFKKKLQELEDVLKIEYNKECYNCSVCYRNANCVCKNDFHCDTCNISIPKSSYFKHKVAHLIKNNNFECEYCQKRLMRKSALTRHIAEVHMGIRKQYTPRSIYTCDICGLTTHRKSRLTQHMRTHTGEKPYKCDECGKAFAQGSQLGAHKRTKHSDQFRFTCEYCSKPLKSKYSLNMHILIMHKPEELERKFGCHICEKKFKFPGELTNHLTWHSNDRKYSCEVCGKRFVNQPSVKKHMVIHSGEKKHKCDICGKGFYHKSYIKVHMKVHNRIL